MRINSLVQEIIRRTGLDQEISKRPKGKRSIAVAKKGKHAHRYYGTNRSLCLWDRKGLRKNAR
ncbi:hypothetical protein [Melghirimyces algeriensis]|uniref:Uncharacterized protein n=1 Tax=Melghirimyces algeriensis TaxID=910412 RepID=A0A521BFF3_9BACL|nr:hypothetical protein [Melghirimyces algeriensis]SMO45450.1 hypothetical protein SAMN06264849_10235 [Melghirimyces algeriensis]